MKGFKIIWALLIVSFVLDAIVTFLQGDLLKYVELNPLYNLVGLFGLYLANIVLIGAAYLIYQRVQSPYYRFTIIWGMIAVIFIRIFLVYNGIHNIMSGITAEQVARVYTPEVKRQLTRAFYINLLPYLLPLIAFKFWETDHEVKRK